MLKTHHHLLSTLVLLLFAITWAAPATADTAADVSKIESLVRRAQANLQSVDQSIGTRTSPPKGSAAKLAKSRLDQAYGDLEPAGKLVAALPAGETGVAEVTKNYNEAVTLYTKLANILSGKAAAPEEKPSDAPAENKPADAPAVEKPDTVRLGYPHADNLKTAKADLRGIEGSVNALVKLHAEFLAVEDQSTLSYRQSSQAMNTINDARTKSGYVEKRLAPIPANGEGVAEAHERLANARVAIDGAEKFFAPLHTKLAAQVDPANYPDLPKDLKWLSDTNNTYRNSAIYLSDADRMAELSSQREASYAELVRIAQKYQPMIMQNTAEGQQIENFGNATIGAFEKFDAEAAQVQTRLPEEIREHLKDAETTAEMAVKEEKPGYFTGGIPQKMGWAQEKLNLLIAIGETEETQALQKEYDQMQAGLNKRAKSLEGLIIKSNELPADNFQGSDRDAAIAIAIDGWKVQQPDAEVLAVRVPTKEWRRETKWTFSNGSAYYYDKSSLQVRLIVADPDNAELAIDRPINVRKDHQSNDSLIGVPLHDFELTELQPGDYLLRSKIK